MNARQETILRIAICIIVVLCVPAGLCIAAWSLFGWMAGISVLLLPPVIFYMWGVRHAPDKPDEP